MRTDDTVSNEDKTNYKTNIFNVIETFSYNGTAVVETPHAINLDIFTPYALNIPLLVKKRLGLFSRVMKGIKKP